MFGYIVPCKSELKMREFETYNAYYCAVCKALKSRYGHLPRLLLSYDSTFFAMLFASLSEGEDEISQFRCGIKPWRKKNLLHGNDAVDYAADIFVMLSYMHLDDDRRDEHKLRGLIGTAAFRRSYKKAALKLPEQAAEIRERLDELSIIESSGEAVSIDEAAEPFAKLMEAVTGGASVLSSCHESESVSLNLQTIGYNLGKWVYLIDAVDDFEGDLESRAFNPLRFQSYTPDRLRFALEMCLAETAKAFELLAPTKNEDILRNIFYVGLRMKTDEILAGYSSLQ